MKKKIGTMNIPFDEVYDEEDDVYYVTFKTGEPSYCVEVDDILLLEVGVFSNFPTGFRILNFTKHNVETIGIGVLIKKFKDIIHKIDRPTLGDREARLKEALKEVLA